MLMSFGVILTGGTTPSDQYLFQYPAVLLDQRPCAITSLGLLMPGNIFKARRKCSFGARQLTALIF
jgi:hypothetical protein